MVFIRRTKTFTGTKTRDFKLKKLAVVTTILTLTTAYLFVCCAENKKQKDERK